MTRLERAIENARKAKEKREALERDHKQDLADQREAERQAEAVKRLEEAKARTRRRYTVGDLAERKGLLRWNDATLADLFALLVTLAPCPNPVAVLESLLREVDADREAISLTALSVSEGVSCTGQREQSLLPA